MKWIAILFLFHVWSPYARADSLFVEIGARGATSWAKHSSNRDSSRDAYKLGTSAGAVVRVGISDWFAVQSEILYATRGSDILLLDGEYLHSFKQSYLEVPILARALFPLRGPVSGYVVAGPAVSYMLSAKIERDDGPIELGRDIVRSFDIGLIGGVGAAWIVAPNWSVSFEARYDAGLRDIVVEPASDLEARNRAILLTLGVDYVLNDADGDGIPNHADRCRTEAEDRDGFEDQDGCPDRDNDGDGILDEVDLCSNEAEDADGFEDQDGCPDIDNDGDGILDAQDRCPDEAFPRNDGCLPHYDRVEIVENRLALTPGILFDQGKWELSDVHRGTLDEVAQVLADYPDMRLRIDGHADTEGGKRTNDEVSELRAREVFLYLTVENKIDRERLEVQGHGVRKPVVYEGSAAEKAQNRRVELVIVAGP